MRPDLALVVAAALTVTGGAAVVPGVQSAGYDPREDSGGLPLARKR